MPKFPTFERNLLSGNSVSFRLMKGKKIKDLLITERVDYYCEKSIISVSTTFSTKSLHQNMYYTLLFKINPRQGNRFFKINVNKYDNLLEFCTQQNSALLQMLIFLPIFGNFARSKQQPCIKSYTYHAIFAEFKQWAVAAHDFGITAFERMRKYKKDHNIIYYVHFFQDKFI